MESNGLTPVRAAARCRADELYAEIDAGRVVGNLLAGWRVVGDAGRDAALERTGIGCVPTDPIGG